MKFDLDRRRRDADVANGDTSRRRQEGFDVHALDSLPKGNGPTYVRRRKSANVERAVSSNTRKIPIGARLPVLSGFSRGTGRPSAAAAITGRPRPRNPAGIRVSQPRARLAPVAPEPTGRGRTA